MQNRRTVIETHLKRAQEAVQTRTKLLTDKKLDEKQRRRDVTLRQFQAAIRKYTRRLKALDKVDAVNADVAQRRAERLAQPKQPKVKKKKEAPAAKAKGDKPRREKKAE